MYQSSRGNITVNLFFISSVLILVSCQENTITEKLLGKWQMTAVLQHEQNVSAEHNPNNDRWIEFYEDKSFETGGTPFGENHGSWYLKNDDHVLYLDSSVENDDSEWQLLIEGDSMKWKGIGDPGKEAFTLKFKKTGQ